MLHSFQRMHIGLRRTSLIGLLVMLFLVEQLYILMACLMSLETTTMQISETKSKEDLKDGLFHEDIFRR